MKFQAFLFPLFFCICVSAQITQVNVIIGDESFLQTFGRLPDATDDEHIRVRTHLSYASKILRERERPDLNDTMKERRLHLLDLLDAYVQHDVYPENADHPESRKPCFIDGKGTICAVGYLVQETEGRDKAEMINGTFQYNLISEMNSDWLAGWLVRWGLTAEEAATIQPTYPWQEQPRRNFLQRWRDKMSYRRRQRHIRRLSQPLPIKQIRGVNTLQNSEITKLLYAHMSKLSPLNDSAEIRFTVSRKGEIKKIKTQNGNSQITAIFSQVAQDKIFTPDAAYSHFRENKHYVNSKREIRLVYLSNDSLLSGRSRAVTQQVNLINPANPPQSELSVKLNTPFTDYNFQLRILSYQKKIIKDTIIPGNKEVKIGSMNDYGKNFFVTVNDGCGNLLMGSFFTNKENMLLIVSTVQGTEKYYRNNGETIQRCVISQPHSYLKKEE